MSVPLRPTSLRLRLFLALAAAMLAGALATGLYAVFADAVSIGFTARGASVAPKALALAAILLPAAALATAWVGGRLARPIEELTEAATRIAEGHRATRLPRGEGEEMQRLSRALVSMRRELEGTPYAAAFLRDAWHDLKTPVAALSATLEILDDETLDDREATRHFLGNLRRSTAQLERHLADLVTLARYETASLRADEAASLRELVGDAVARVEPLAEATQVTMKVTTTTTTTTTHGAGSDGEGTGANGGDRVRCDPSAVGRALANLLENAVSATPGGNVSIAVEADESDVVAVDVINEPAFVPDEARARLFERTPRSRDGRSSGLGLAMARAAIEAHGGTVRFLELGPPRVKVRLEIPK